VGGEAAAMKVLVTGGGGFLGRRIAERLNRRGCDVRVLGRSHYPSLSALGIDSAQGDVRNPAIVRDACRGMDAVYHVAALAGIWGDRRSFWSINVDGTRHVLDACRANGVRALIYTSSPSVVFGKEELCGVDERQPYPRRYLAVYPQTKAVAERMVLDANGHGLATVALRPHLICGPGDPHLIPRVIERARRGQLMQVGDGANLVDVTFVDTAAEAHVQAGTELFGERKCAGRAYFISQGEPICLWPWLRTILAGVGAPPIRRTISFPAAYTLGSVLEAIWRMLRRRTEPRMTRFLALQLARSHYFNIAAAQRDFGFRPLENMADVTQCVIDAHKAVRPRGDKGLNTEHPEYSAS
jgi:nucleoside-diphosphate-sugar epimerase